MSHQLCVAIFSQQLIFQSCRCVSSSRQDQTSASSSIGSCAFVIGYEGWTRIGPKTVSIRTILESRQFQQWFHWNSLEEQGSWISSAYVMCQCLKATRSALRKWGKEASGNMSNKITRLQIELDHIRQNTQEDIFGEKKKDIYQRAAVEGTETGRNLVEAKIQCHVAHDSRFQYKVLPLIYYHQEEEELY